MLSEEEKNKIQLEETYRAEIKEKYSKPPSFFDKIDGPMKFVQGFAIAVGIILSLLQYSRNSQSEREEAARNYQKTFHEEQMKVYAETVHAASIISTATPLSPEYMDARQQFLQLFWGRMSMFEDKCVEGKMVLFRKLLIKFEKQDYSILAFKDACSETVCYYDTIDQVALKKAALKLAHQCRLYTIKTWLPIEEQVKYTIDSLDCLEINN
jgi:hypothetical protein